MLKVDGFIDVMCGVKKLHNFFEHVIRVELVWLVNTFLVTTEKLFFCMLIHQMADTSAYGIFLIERYILHFLFMP